MSAADILQPPSTCYLLPENRTSICSTSGWRFFDIRKSRFPLQNPERNSDWSKLVIVVSFPLASNWSKDQWGCKHKFDREGDPFQTKSHKSAQNEDAVMEVWHPSCNFNDKSQQWRRQSGKLSEVLDIIYFSLSGQPNSRLLIRRKTVQLT